MRIGRIILALLAPLLSFSPALRAEIPAENKQPGQRLSVLGLADLLCFSAPGSALDAGSDVHSAGSWHSAPLAIFADIRDGDLLAALPRVEKDASLRLLSRQRQHLLLRC